MFSRNENWSIDNYILIMDKAFIWTDQDSRKHLSACSCICNVLSPSEKFPGAWLIWLSCDYHVPGCLSFTFSFPIKFWCMGMFWWIQPNKHRSAVCSCHANYNHSEGYGRQGNADLSKLQSLLKLLLQSKYDRIWFYFLWKLIANWNMTVLHIYTGI